MPSKIKIFGFEKNYTRYEKDFGDKIVHLKKIYNFTQDNFLIRHLVFILIVKNLVKDEKFHIYTKSMRVAKKEARSSTTESCVLGALKLTSEARDKNVPAKRADFLSCNYIPLGTPNCQKYNSLFPLIP